MMKMVVGMVAVIHLDASIHQANTHISPVLCVPDQWQIIAMIHQHFIMVIVLVSPNGNIKSCECDSERLL